MTRRRKPKSPIAAAIDLEHDLNALADAARLPRKLVGDFYGLDAALASRWTEDREDLCIMFASIEGSVDHPRRDEDGVARVEDALVPIQPLFDLAYKDIDHFLLVWMLVEAMSLAGHDDGFGDG
jgi:hypothetical protein